MSSEKNKKSTFIVTITDNKMKAVNRTSPSHIGILRQITTTTPQQSTSIVRQKSTTTTPQQSTSIVCHKPTTTLQQSTSMLCQKPITTPQESTIIVHPKPTITTSQQSTSTTTIDNQLQKYIILRPLRPVPKNPTLLQNNSQPGSNVLKESRFIISKHVVNPVIAPQKSIDKTIHVGGSTVTKEIAARPSTNTEKITSIPIRDPEVEKKDITNKGTKRKIEEVKSKISSIIKCKICSKTYNLDKYNEHITSKIDIISCKFCSKIFTDFDKIYAVHQHVKEIHGKYPFCTKCKEIFLNEKDLKNHSLNCNKCRMIILPTNTVKTTNVQTSVVMPSKEVVQKLPERIKNDVMAYKKIRRSNVIECQNCTDDFESKQELIDHKCTYEINAKKIANTCKSYSKLIYKVRKYKNCRFYITCKLCKKDIPTYDFVSPYLHNCVKKYKFTCPFCGKDKKSIKKDCKLSIHIDNHCDDIIDNKHINCKKCNKTFFNSYNLEKHDQFIHSKKSLINNKPNKDESQIFISKAKTPTKIIYTFIPEFNKEMPCYRCTSCYKLISINLYNEHKLRHIYSCIFCTQLLPIQKLMKSHLAWKSVSRVHLYEYYLENDQLFDEIKSNTIIKLTEIQRYLVKPPLEYQTSKENCCPVCYLQFQFHCQLLRHQDECKHDYDIYKCAECKLNFSSWTSFETHSKTHRSLICHHCNEILQSITELIQHIDQLHKIENSLIECELCLKKKSDIFKIQKHFNKNHIDKRFSCYICYIKLNSKLELIKHLLNHDIKIYKCDFCDFQFSCKQYLYQHVKTCKNTLCDRSH